MTRTLLVTLDLPVEIIARGELPVIALAVEEDLKGAGHPVVSVRPWDEPAQPTVLGDAMSPEGLPET